MIEYPSIMNSSKAPREHCVAFDKLDGSNIRVKYTQKRGFHLFGSRTQLIDETHPHLGKVISVFNNTMNEPLSKIVRDEWPNEREVIAYGEFFGPGSFAGQHDPNTEKHFLLFDVLIGHKNRKFVPPREFIKKFVDKVPTPVVVYEGNLTDQFIKEVREDRYCLNEGVICKGVTKTGAARGGIWMCKIKTQRYLDKVLNRYGEDGLKQFGE